MNNYASSFRVMLLFVSCFFKITRGGSYAIILVVLFTANEAVSGGYGVNKNKVSNLFNEEIEDRQGLEQFLEDSSREAQKGVEGKAAIDALGQKEGALQQKAAELDAVNANDLEARGREERAGEENTYFDKLEIDYSNPQILTHKNDIDKIADASNKLVSKLFDGLRDIGIDCKQIKGDKELEPNYSLDIKKEDFKETIYERKVCEVLRNQYSCKDALTLRCAKKGMQWGQWQARTVDIVGSQVYWEAKDLGYAIHWKRKRWGWHLNFSKQKEWRSYLSSKLGIPLEQISEAITFPSGNWGGSVGEPPVNIGEEYRHVYPYYRFGYYYRSGHEICEQWSEDWNEVCKLQ